MVKTKEKWLGYLNLYGSDFNRWPLALSDQQKQEVKDMPEYADACDIDMVLDKAEWPLPSPDLKERTLAQIHQMEEENSAKWMSPAFIVLTKHPVFMAACFILFLCAGLTSGMQYNTAMKDRMDYNYFSLGPAYTFETFAGGHNE